MFTTPKKFSRRHLVVGARGEALAADFLEEKGYHIIQRNFRCRLGEIDLIAKVSETLVFIEVKTRSNKNFGSPLLAIDHRKQLKISRVALCYLGDKGLNNQSCRFDVVSVLGREAPYEIELIQNAFDLAL